MAAGGDVTAQFKFASLGQRSTTQHTQPQHPPPTPSTTTPTHRDGPTTRAAWAPPANGPRDKRHAHPLPPLFPSLAKSQSRVCIALHCTWAGRPCSSAARSSPPPLPHAHDLVVPPPTSSHPKPTPSTGTNIHPHNQSKQSSKASIMTPPAACC